MRYNPLFLYGGVGLGKTHLLHAVGHEAIARNPAARVRYVSSETYVNDLIAAIRSGQMDRFRTRYRDECDVLLIDDIQFIAGKDRTQEEFFHMFNTLHSSHKQIVMTCDQMPSAIPHLEERLRSRLQWGLIADIKPPSFETRVAIVERKAAEDGIVLPKDVAMLLARHITRNVRELEGALMRLDAQARIFGQPIALETARTFLGDIVDGDLRRVSPQLIIKAVCETFEVTEAAMKGPRRHRHITQPRQIAMYLIRDLTDESLPRIGSLFGGRDHTTVLNALKRIEHLKSANPVLRDRVERLARELTR
jgi:chromosomal replication initiator protein